MPPRSPIAHDDELAAFILSCVGKMRQADIVAACRKRFGSARAPSQPAINRFIVPRTTADLRRTFVSRSLVLRDPALAAFVLDAAARMPQVDIPAACRDRFGWSPSRASISRFLTVRTTVAQRTYKLRPPPIDPDRDDPH